MTAYGSCPITGCPHDHVRKSRKTVHRFLIVWTALLVGFGCANPTMESIVRVPTRPQISLAPYAPIVIVQFLVYEDFQGVDDDPWTDYGEEVEITIRNELQSHLQREDIRIVPLQPGVEREDIPLPPPDAWQDDAFVLDWLHARWTVPEDVQQAERPAVIFGVVHIAGADRSGLIAPTREEMAPRRRAYGRRIGRYSEFRLGIRLYVIDWHQHTFIHREAVETSRTFQGVDRMDLTIFYILADRVMPDLLRAIVPIYIQTERIFVRDIPSSGASR